MTLSQLASLVAIIDCGLNVTAAAARLNATQPGVSKQIQQLEAELGGPLFVRRGRSLARLTAIGQAASEHARLILAEVYRLRQSIVDMKPMVKSKTYETETIGAD